MKRTKFADEVQKSAEQELSLNEISSDKKLAMKSTKMAEINWQFLSDLHSFEDLQSFLESETEHRKRNKKSAVTRRLSQDMWKSLKKRLLNSFNEKLPNKSIKLSRKLLKDALHADNLKS